MAMRHLGRAAIYLLLGVVGCTMLTPFLWMCSSALKPDEQIFRGNLIPTQDFVTVDGVRYAVDRKIPSPDSPGEYRILLLEGPRAGKSAVVSTNALALNRAGDGYVYSPDAGEASVPVSVLEKIKPLHYLVTAHGAEGGAKLDQASIPETDITTRPALRWENFVRAVRVSGVFGRSYLNSFVVAVLITMGQVFTSSMAAYAFARLRFPGRDTLFLAYLATLMIPDAVTMIPVFVILKSMPEILNGAFNTRWFFQDLYLTFKKVYYVGKPLGLDSYFALIVPGLFSAYGTFMLRQFFLGLPRDLEDAARIDGCGYWGVYSNVILPLSKPALAALTLFTFMGAWQGFLWPMVVTSTPDMQTLPVMLQSFMGVTGAQWNLLMAGTLLVLAPMMIVFLAGQKYFIAGIQLGAIKG